MNTVDSPLVMVTQESAAATVGRWIRAILPGATLRGIVTGLADDGNTLTVEGCVLTAVHLDMVAVWVENDD